MDITECSVRSAPFCTYITYHPSGKFYLGKGVTADVERGKYIGSGHALSLALKKYPRYEWTTSIIQTFEDEAAAYEHEAVLIEPHLGDPRCLNLQGGGMGGRKASKLTVERNRAAQLIAQNRPEVNLKRSKSLKLVLSQPMVKKTRSEAQRRSWGEQQRREKTIAAVAESQRRDEVRERKSVSMQQTLNKPEMQEKWKKAQTGMKVYHDPSTGRNTMCKVHPGEPWVLGRFKKEA
jgi:hypothetical protein